MTLPTTPRSQIKALHTDWVQPAYFDTFEDALIHVTLEVGSRIQAMREAHTRETSGFVQYGRFEDDDWVTFEIVPKTTGERWRDRVGDIWALGEDGLLHTPETRPFPRAHVEKKWGPLTPVE